MKTASFFTYTGPGRVSIARYAPRGTPAGFRIYKPLAPTQPMLKMAYEPYRDLYFGSILAPLDPQMVVDDLHEFAAGAEPVLLCWERPPFDIARSNWCHRRMVAEWIEDNLGLDVAEYEPPVTGTLL